MKQGNATTGVRVFACFIYGSMIYAIAAYDTYETLAWVTTVAIIAGIGVPLAMLSRFAHKTDSDDLRASMLAEAVDHLRKHGAPINGASHQETETKEKGPKND